MIQFLKFSIYILLSLISFSGFNQNFADKDFYLIDSLKLNELSKGDIELLDSSLKLFREAQNDTSKINAIGIICENMMHADWVKYQRFQHNFIKEAKAKNPSEKINLFLLRALATSLNNLGYIDIKGGKVLSGIGYYTEALKIQEELDDKKGVATSYNNIGLVYYDQGDIPTSLEYFHKSLKIKEQIGRKKGIATTLTNIGGIYKVLENHDLALTYYKKALVLEQGLDNKKGIAVCFNHIGFIYETKGDISLAKEYYQKSLMIYGELGYKEGMAVSYGNLGNIYKMMNEIPLAKRNLQKSLDLRKELNDQKGMIISLIKVAQLDYEQNELKNGEEKTKEALKLSQEIGFPKLIKISSLLMSQIYEKQGKGMASLEMYKLSKIMSDSINNEITQKASVKQQAKFEYEKQKVIDDSENEKLVAIEKKEKEKQQIISSSIAVGLILVILFLIFVFNRLKITRKQKVIIEEQNKDIIDSINYAKRIQDAILPTKEEVKKILPNSFIFYNPKDIVAGDFYWVDHQGDNISFAAADCTGHGVPGAMVSVVCHNALNRVVRENSLISPNEILDKTREIVAMQLSKSNPLDIISMSNMRDGMDVALCNLNTKTNELQYSGAQNPLWILRKENDEIEEIKANKQSIGKVETPKSYDLHSVKLNKGDTIYIFSDGYADQFGGEKGKKFKYKPLKQLLISIKDESMNNQLELITNHFNNWKGSFEQVDDVCIIGVRI